MSHVILITLKTNSGKSTKSTTQTSWCSHEDDHLQGVIRGVTEILILPTHLLWSGLKLARAVHQPNSGVRMKHTIKIKRKWNPSDKRVIVVNLKQSPKTWSCSKLIVQTLPVLVHCEDMRKINVSQSCTKKRHKTRESLS